MPNFNGILLSSTNDPEVRKYRMAAKEVINEEEFRDKWYAREMDEFPASSSSALQACQEFVLECSVYIGILGPFYGSVNTSINLSYTQFEYEVAFEAGREIGIFLLPDNILSSSDPKFVTEQSANIKRQKSFKDTTRTKHTVPEVTDIEDFKKHVRRYLRTLRNKYFGPPEPPRSSEDHMIHILTGGKGGIGKTLVGLSIVCSYVLDLQKSILAIDLNSMNHDLSRLLALGRPKPLDNWRSSKIEGDSNVVWPPNPYVLPEGAKGFWEKLSDIVSKGEFLSHNAVVDTNLHIANTEGGIDSPQGFVHSILKVSKRKILFWILWTYASINDNESIVRTINRFRDDYGEGIEFVHVLNPSALMPPRRNLNLEIEHIIQVRNEEQMIVQLMRSNNIEDKSSLEQILYRLNQKSTELFQQIRDSAEPYTMIGSRELWDLPILNEFDDLEFITMLAENLESFGENRYLSLYEKLSEYGGRPRNILPISTHNTSLFGYTEVKKLGKNIGDIRNRIKEVQMEISAFLRQLDRTTIT